MGDRVSSEGLTPRGERVRVEESIGPRVRQWIDRAGARVTDVATALGLRREELEVFEGARHFRLAWVLLFPPLVRREAFVDLAREVGLVVADAHDVHGVRDLLRAVARWRREDGEACGVVLEAVADGVVSRGERARVLREIEDCERSLATLRAAIEAAPVAADVVVELRGGDR